MHSTPSKSFVAATAQYFQQNHSPIHHPHHINHPLLHQSPISNNNNSQNNNSTNNNSSPHSSAPSSRHNSPNHSLLLNNKLTKNASSASLSSPASSSSATSSPVVLPPHAYALQQKQRSFLTFGFGAGGSGPSRRESHVNVNVTPTSHDASSDTPEIRKYKKRFNSEILCAALWGVNLLIGTENGLMLLDRSGQGKVNKITTGECSMRNTINRSFFAAAGLSIDLKTSIPANGSLGGSKHSGHHIGQKESCSRLLFIMVEIENSTH